MFELLIKLGIIANDLRLSEMGVVKSIGDGSQSQGGVCTAGAYWILAVKSSDSCDTACATELIPSQCAGDSTIFNGWPYGISELESAVESLDNRFAKAKRCGIASGVDFGDDDHVPEFYYLDPLEEGCSKWFIKNPGSDYLCAATTKFNGNRLCPCCLPPPTTEPTFKPNFRPTYEPTFEQPTFEPTFEPTYEVFPTYEPTFSDDCPRPGCKTMNCYLEICQTKCNITQQFVNGTQQNGTDSGCDRACLLGCMGSMQECEVCEP